MKKYYWTTKDGKKMDVDTMTEEHLRNVLKMIIRNRKEREFRGDEPEGCGEEYAFDYLWKV